MRVETLNEDSTGAPLIVVAIPTCRRPEMLAKLLYALGKQREAPPFIVLVADNDATAREGMEVAASPSIAALPLHVETMLVAERGLSTVRNALFRRAMENPAVTHIAMLDDDQWPPVDWLARLYAGQIACGADMVAGPIDFDFPDGRPKWANETVIFRFDPRRDGPIRLWTSANVLLSRKTLEILTFPWFDPRFNHMGGEDLDFFTCAREHNLSAHWISDARVFEAVPPERASIRWAMQRMWRNGQTDMQVMRKHAPPLRRTLLPLRASAQLVVRSLLMPLALFPTRHRYDLLGEWIKAIARLSIYLGKSADHYAFLNQKG